MAGAVVTVGAWVALIQGGYGHQKTLLEHWNGKRWALVAST